MKIRIISAIENQAGLQRDYLILRDLLTGMGHQVEGIAFHAVSMLTGVADLNIFLEIIDDGLMPMARHNWFFPNPEYLQEQWRHLLPEFDLILCKSRDTVRLMTSIAGNNIVFTGFESRDRFQSGIEKERMFLHVAGRSVMKNTEAVLGAWRDHGVAAPLVVVSRQHETEKMPDNVKVFCTLSDEILRYYQNTCWFHLVPSAYEGWGHVIHEGMSCRSCVLTTDGEPMNEWQPNPQFRVPWSGSGKQDLATTFKVDAGVVADFVEQVMELSDGELKHEGLCARYAFEKEQLFFRSQLTRLLRVFSEKP